MRELNDDLTAEVFTCSELWLYEKNTDLKDSLCLWICIMLKKQTLSKESLVFSV